MPAVHVTVRLSGVLAQRLGSRRTVELDPPATVEALLAQLAREAAFDADGLRGLAVVAGGRFLDRDRPLDDGQEVDVLVPVAGG
jgi:molybdopterin converting factor small subunit